MPGRPLPNSLDGARPGAFCWLDLAADDVGRAQAFYAEAFGWRYAVQPANGGHYTRCRVGGVDVASMYQLRQAQLAAGVPSHWTPYVHVHDIDALAHRIGPLGGRVVVSPFDVEGTARIALVQDAVGALLGLWQPTAAPAASRPSSGGSG